MDYQALLEDNDTDPIKLSIRYLTMFNLSEPKSIFKRCFDERRRLGITPIIHPLLSSGSERLIYTLSELKEVSKSIFKVDNISIERLSVTIGTIGMHSYVFGFNKANALGKANELIFMNR